MAKVTSPCDYLTSREKYQITKFKLRSTEDQLLKAFDAKTVAELETAMLRERSKKHPRFSELTTLYHQQHQDFAAAEEVFEIATSIQRARVAEMQKDYVNTTNSIN
jgi:hypothetical protein